MPLAMLSVKIDCVPDVSNRNQRRLRWHISRLPGVRLRRHIVRVAVKCPLLPALPLPVQSRGVA